MKASLFGKFNITCGEERPPIRARKVQELLIYLLVFRKHPQPRESLAEVLWADEPATISKKNLRQTLWHLQSMFRELKTPPGLELLIEDGWIHIQLPTDFWLDTQEFEQVYERISHRRASELSVEDFTLMQYAVRLYTGDLLEGWYQDWCIFERERFQLMNLTLLDKLVRYCEIHREYEVGLSYGWQILRYDYAYERAHRQLMRLYAMSGDRTQALHQYQRCVNALRDELGVEPSTRTKQLYQQIQADTFVTDFVDLDKVNSNGNEGVPILNNMLNHLKEFSLSLRTIEVQVEQEIAVLENTLGS
jgi:DNA-binding SARP family transcriptional activator